MADQPQPTRTLVVGGGIIALLGAGWFVLSHVVMDTDIADALGEALGVVLALAVVASIAGAVLSGRGKPG
jgi:cation transporter-like permease